MGPDRGRSVVSFAAVIRIATQIFFPLLIISEISLHEDPITNNGSEGKLRQIDFFFLKLPRTVSENVSCLFDLALRLHYTCLVRQFTSLY